MTIIRRFPGTVSGPNAALLDYFVPGVPVSTVRRWSAGTVAKRAGETLTAITGLSASREQLIPGGVIGATMPAVVAGAVPYLDFNGTTDRLVSADTITTTFPSTLFGLIRTPTVVGDGKRAIIASPASGTNISFGLHVRGTSTGQVADVYFDATPTQTGIAVPVGEWFAYVLVLDGASSVLRINGIEAAVSLSSPALTGRYTLGFEGGAGSDTYAAYQVNEVGHAAVAADEAMRAAIVDVYRQGFSLDI